MHSVEIDCEAREGDLLAAALWEEGTLGIEEEQLSDGRVRLRAYFAEPGAREGRWREEADRDWVSIARSEWQPLEVGERFFVAPPWDTTPTPAGRLRISIAPGQASGTGYSTPTQLCLEALERMVRPGDAVLDVGTGSGILALAAKLLGAGRVMGCDADLDALGEARVNLGDRALLWCGSPRSMASSPVDLVVANLTAPALRLLAHELRRVTRGGLIVSGFRMRRAEEMRVLFGGEVVEREGWGCIATCIPSAFFQD